MKYNIFPVSPNRKVTLCGTNVYPNPEFHPDRVMPEHDLLYIYSGSWTIGQDDTAYDLQAGDVILLRAGSHHFGPSPCSVNARTMFIHMNRLPNDRGDVEMSASETEPFLEGGSFCLPTVIHCGQDNEVTSLFRSIIDTYWSHRKDAARRQGLLLNLLLNEMTNIALKNREREEEWSVALIQMFRENSNRTYSLSEVARIAGMGERTLSARFHEITGESIHQYQLNLKLDEAYKILRGGGYNVKTVAERFGFCDPYYFSRMFKKRFGVSPKQIKAHDPSANINRPPAD